jgi:hypothetical protein
MAKLKKKRRPGTTPEAVESEMIALAMDVAREQMENRSVSSQVLTHFIKAGAIKNTLEQRKLELELELVKAKTDSIKSSKNVEDLMKEALKAMRTYSGRDYDD